jgi:hypothetical protein
MGAAVAVVKATNIKEVVSTATLIFILDYPV